MDRDDGLPNFLHLALIGHFGGILDHDDFAITLHHFVHHAGCCGDEVLVKFAF